MKRLIFVTLLVLLLAVPLGSVFAEPLFDTVVEEGETVNNDVIVLDGDLQVEESATINGDVVVFNGDADVEGTINGDLVIFNGDLDAGNQARIDGDCVLLNGDVDNHSASRIRCTNIEGTVLPGIVQGIPPVPGAPAPPERPERSQRPSTGVDGAPTQVGNAFADFTRVLFSSVLMAGLAFVVASAFPNHLLNVKSTVRKKPVASGAVGFLTAIAVPIVAVILTVISAVLTIICIGLLGFPIVMIIILGLVAAVAMGWIAAGTWLGERLFQRRTLSLKAALGTLLLTFVLGLLGILTGGWLEGLLGAMVTSIGLGAVALTQFGRKPYAGPDEPDPADEDDDKISIVMNTLPDDTQDSISKA